MAPSKKKSGAQNEKQKRKRAEDNTHLSKQMKKWVSVTTSTHNKKETPINIDDPSNSENLHLDVEENNLPPLQKQPDNKKTEDQSSEKEIISKSPPENNNEQIIQYEDPATWPLITDKFKCHLIQLGPLQVNEHLTFFPLSEDGRCFKKTWFYKTLPNGEMVRRNWLLYSVMKNTLFCFPCLLFSVEKKSYFSDINKGFSDWRHLSPRLPDHENSVEHRNCYIKWKEFERRLRDCKTIDDELEKAIKLESEKWQEILKVIVDVILFCGKNNLALRGSTNEIGTPNSGIFLNLIELISHYNPVIYNHLQTIKSNKPSVTYLSLDIQNEMINLMGNKVRQEILKEIKESKYFSVLFDGTPDISKKEQMSQILRYIKITKNVISIEEKFIDFIDTHEKTGEGLAEEILSKLESDGLDIKNCRGQGYDNAANMAGKYRGVQANIIRKNELATFIPCVSHSLNLIGVHASEILPIMITFFSIVENIFVYFSKSTSRWNKLMAVLKISLKGHSTTRWSSKKRAVTALYTQIEQVHSILKDISQDLSLNVETVSGANQILIQIDYKFICLLDIWCKILTHIDRVNILLQGEKLSLDVASKLLKGLTMALQELRNEGFETTLNKAKIISTKLDISPDFLNKRQRKVKRFHSEEAIDEGYYLTPSELFSKDCYMVFDNILGQLQWRFESMHSICSDFNFLYGKSIETMSSGELRKQAEILASKYKNDLNAEEFGSEIESFKFQALSMCENIQLTTPLELLNIIHTYELSSVYPNIDIAIRIFITQPVTIASCERSFSKLKLIKNYLRSSMGQDRLTNLAILSINYEVANALKYDEIIKEFALRKARKVKF